MLNYNPRHVSSSTLLIFRRTNCIITASGIVTLWKRPYSMPVESGLQSAVYAITICMLHYNPQHVSSSTLLIFRRTNCIITASGIVTLCKRPYSMPVESGLLRYNPQHVSSSTTLIFRRSNCIITASGIVTLCK